MQVQREREIKLDLDTRLMLPSADELVGRPVRVERDELELSSTYYDTSDRALLRQHVTLRRREGNDDTGWHLKIPAGDARTELRLPLSAGERVPDELASLVRGIAGGSPLGPVAVIDTARHLSRVYEGASMLLEIADDDVRATELPAAERVRAWRELEVELGAGDERTLARVAKRLVKAGAQPASSRSKLARALGTGEPHFGDDAGGLLARYLDEQYAALCAGDLAPRRGLHVAPRVRSAGHRTRGALRAFGKLLAEPDDARRLADELAWFLTVLGAVADQMQRERLVGLTRALPAELVLGPVVSTIENTIAGEVATSAAELVAALDSDRYLAMMAELATLSARPHVGAGVDVNDLLRRAIRARSVAGRRVSKAVHDGDAQVVDRALDAVRRSLAAAELTAPADGKAADRVVDAQRAGEQVVGDYRESIEAQARLVRLGVAAGRAGGNGFTFGLLWVRQGAAARDALRSARGLEL